MGLFNNEYKGYIKRNLCKGESDVLKATDAFINFYQTAEGQARKKGKRKARNFFKGEHTKFILNDYIKALRIISNERNLAKGKAA